MIRHLRRRFVVGSVACVAELSLGRGAIGEVRQSGPATPAAGPDAANRSTAATARPASADAVLFDGASGVTTRYFNVGALLPWENNGGDWTDAQGAAQGPKEYAQLTSSAPGAFAGDVTALIKHWYANGNTGAYLKASGAAHVATRVHADSNAQPVLLLVDPAGTITRVPCSASGVMDSSTAYAPQGADAMLGDGKHLALQFDLPQLMPSFAAARLQLTSLHNYSVPLTLQVYELRPPRLFAGGTPTPGLAARYSADTGIEKDPDVYFAGFDASNFPEGSLSIDRNAAPDKTYPGAINAVYQVGTSTACNLVHRWSTKRGNLPTRNPHNGLLIRAEMPSEKFLERANADCPSELFFRYYLKLKTGYQCAVEGKKLPGLAGRYGIWRGNDHFGYYSTQTGNGGAPTTGDFDGQSLNGWSMRNHAYQAPADRNPLARRIPLTYYAYTLDMGNDYGDFWRWGSPSLGYVNVEAERWYCLEHYVKVNTVHGPFDRNGNGIAVADGAVRGWLDGVLVFEKTNAVLRKHPAIRIDEVWLDHYHGGTTPAEAPHAFAMAALVVARKYIGPRKSGSG